MSKTKKIFIWTLVAIIIAAGLFGYFTIKNLVVENKQAETVLDDAERYHEITAAIIVEQDRCNTLLAQESGNFDDFQYCQQFVRWSADVLE